MSIQYSIDDFVLNFSDSTEKVQSTVHKYDAFLDALTTEDFAHLRDATRKAIECFVSDSIQTTEQMAIANFKTSPILQRHYEAVDRYLEKFPIKDRKSFSIDLATGTGKSWLIYAVAQIMLAEGLVDKVLVLCPSLTIEEELKQKFELFSGTQNLTKILQELGARYVSPSIKSANDPILNGDICVENIHAAYERTGSSIEDSFKGKGSRVLVISDEAHHIYSDANAAVRKWYEFLMNPDYDFSYLLGVTGTPYINDEYFHDVIYRYSLRQAMDDGIIKKIDYKREEEYQEDKGFHETYANHKRNQEQYADQLQPITILVTDKIVTCVAVWKDLVDFLSEKEKLSFDQASKKVIWVASGIPSNAAEKEYIQSLFEHPEKTRKANLANLKTVDDPANPVEWIVSVSMLTEGWDVKNVFQIVPHEQRAFNSKLLISQVLGRGLRIPAGLEQPIYVKINNHERWTEQIENLYKEVLEIENRISWKYDPSRDSFAFPLYNLTYDSVQDTVEVKEKPASAPGVVTLDPQSKSFTTHSTYSVTGTFRFTVDRDDFVSVEQAAREIKLFLKTKDTALAKKWSLKKLVGFIQASLKAAGQPADYISAENLSKLKQAFGPMFRETGTWAVRWKLQADNLLEVSVDQMASQSFSENALKNHTHVFYTSTSGDILDAEEKAIFLDHIDKREKYDEIKQTLKMVGQDTDAIEYLQTNLHPISDDHFKAPLNLLVVSFEPEYRFTQSMLDNSDLLDSFLKSPDKGFYSFPYSYKPSETGSTHVRHENFNPDFFLKVTDKNQVLVVEIKAEGDTGQKNKAKLRDGAKHFQNINAVLSQSGLDWQYFFYFLSPEDITEFFQAVREDRYSDWRSSLMQNLYK